MLDSNFNVKLGDFGLARLMDHELAPRTTGLAGTTGYLAPEYIHTGIVATPGIFPKVFLKKHNFF